ncbi:MAG: carbon monoxide dehydrogenase beta subunit family protein [Pseudomonadota bacterium]
MILTPNEAATFLKEEKKKLLVAGSMCNDLEVGGKKLLDYVVEIAKLTDTPIAATGNTMLQLVKLKEDNEIKAKKMMVADVINFIRAEKWEEPITPERPELLVFLGYYPDVARMLISTVKNTKTMFLDCRYLEGATYSTPDLSSKEWDDFLNKLIDNLKS